MSKREMLLFKIGRDGVPSIVLTRVRDPERGFGSYGGCLFKGEEVHVAGGSGYWFVYDRDDYERIRPGETEHFRNFKLGRTA